MKYKWLNERKNKKIIVFFNGWGMDENAVSNLNPEDYDVLMFFDYNSLDTDFDFSDLKNYDECYLIAWSMGVMVATLFNFNYKFKTAINGTLKPIDNEYGIPERIYDLTLRGFSPMGAQKFIKNMFDNKTEGLKIDRDFESQKTELSALKNYSANQNFIYNRVIISANDKIIPTHNQIAFWKQQANLSGGHFPFDKFSSWSELL